MEMSNQADSTDKQKKKSLTDRTKDREAGRDEQVRLTAQIDRRTDRDGQARLSGNRCATE